MREQFSIECRKTNTEVIALANHVRRTNQNAKQTHVAGVKRGKTRASKSRLFWFRFILIRWKSGTSFVNQSQSVVMQN